MTLLRAALVLLHLGGTAAWLGAMLYSLLVVQPRAAAFFRDRGELEDFTIVLAAGARAKVLALIAVVGGSGAALTALEVTEHDSLRGLWLALVAMKIGLLLGALALFVYVSWRLWPARALAHALGSPDAPAVRARFRTVALTLTAIVTAALVLGAAADAVGPD
jgi:hypothetical protein